MADSQWYYAVGGEQLGPVSTAELRESIRAGNVGPEDLVWCEGMPDWTESRSVKALMPVRRVAKAPSPAAAPAANAAEVQVRRTRTAAHASRPAEVSVAAPPVEAPPQVSSPNAPPPAADNSDTEISFPSPNHLSDSVATPDSGLDMAGDDGAAEPPEGNQYNLDDSLPDALAGRGIADSSESVSDEELSDPEVQPIQRRKSAPRPSVASARGAADAAPNALYAVFLLVLWIVTALALMAVSIVFAIQWKKATHAAEQTATATTFVVWFVAVYCIARACERVLQLLGHHKP